MIFSSKAEAQWSGGLFNFSFQRFTMMAHHLLATMVTSTKLCSERFRMEVRQIPPRLTMFHHKGGILFDSNPKRLNKTSQGILNSLNEAGEARSSLVWFPRRAAKWGISPDSFICISGFGFTAGHRRLGLRTILICSGILIRRCSSSPKEHKALFSRWRLLNVRGKTVVQSCFSDLKISSEKVCLIFGGLFFL